MPADTHNRKSMSCQEQNAVSGTSFQGRLLEWKLEESRNLLHSLELNELCWRLSIENR